MIISGKKKLSLFWEEYRDAKAPLQRWIRIVSTSHWNNFLELRQAFGSADYHKGATIFDLGGNKYRLIATINYELQFVTVEYVLTHLQYSTDKWKKEYES